MALKQFSLPVSGYLYDYECGVFALRAPRNEEDRVETIRKLCEISRDIEWGLGDPSEYESRYIQTIVNWFAMTLDLIDGGKPDQNAGKVSTYRSHIDKRMRNLQSAKPKREMIAI